jgi:hypothetical protein
LLRERLIDFKRAALLQSTSTKRGLTGSRLLSDFELKTARIDDGEFLFDAKGERVIRGGHWWVTNLSQKGSLVIPRLAKHAEGRAKAPSTKLQTPSTKLQAPSSKHQRSSNNQLIANAPLWSFMFGASLELGAWDLVLFFEQSLARLLPNRAMTCRKDSLCQIAQGALGHRRLDKLAPA